VNAHCHYAATDPQKRKQIWWEWFTNYGFGNSDLCGVGSRKKLRTALPFVARSRQMASEFVEPGKELFNRHVFVAER
jgi:hypothetical protein